jgi:predicted nucleotidyltransferase
MIQKCTILKVLEVFFIEPTTAHFIREISRKINLAPTSVRNHIKELMKQGLIIKKKANPFDCFLANRENEDFIFYKRIYNFFSLKELTNFLIHAYYPKLIVVYGSYSLGEDIEASDIDILILSKVKKRINLEKFEKKLKRTVHIFVVDSLNKLDVKLMKNIYNGIVLYGGF